MAATIYWLTLYNRSFNAYVMCHSQSLNHWGRPTHICVSKLTIIGSDNGLSPRRRQAIIGTNAGILSVEPLGTNFSGILIEIHTFSFKEIQWKMAAIISRLQCVNTRNGQTSPVFVRLRNHWVNSAHLGVRRISTFVLPTLLSLLGFHCYAVRSC